MTEARSMAMFSPWIKVRLDLDCRSSGYNQLYKLQLDMNSITKALNSPMKSCPGGKTEVFPEGGLEFEPNCA